MLLVRKIFRKERTRHQICGKVAGKVKHAISDTEEGERERERDRGGRRETDRDREKG